MSVLKIPTAEVFLPLLEPARHKVAKGGRGSGKSHFFAGLLIEDSLAEPSISGEGLRSVCIREIQNDLAQSVKLLLETKLSQFGLGEADGFKVFNDVIQTPRDGIITFKGMNNYTADSAKSLEGFKRAWWEEAHTASQKSIRILRPTIRAKGSQMWWSYNPFQKTDPISKLFDVEDKPTGSTVITANWRDNPWWTEELEQERLDCLRLDPDNYAHIWEGDYISVVEGAYYAKHLTQARAENRIGFFNRDPLLPIYAFIDIGGSSNKADSFVFWIVQRIGLEKRALAYYEAVGQEFSVHVNWLRNNGFGSAIIVLPHDGTKHDNVYDVTPEGFFRAAGFKTEIMKNQGMGAAMLRIEAGRRDFGNWRFNEERCQGGIDALANYHEKKDEKRNIGLGVNHDWSSHGADAFGLACVWFEINKSHIQADWDEPIRAKYNGVL